MRASALVRMLALVLGLGGCSWSTFSDIADKAPATKISAPDEIRSGAFGDAIVGMDRGAGQQGAALVIVGNGAASLTTATIGVAGQTNVAQISRDDLNKHLEGPNRIHSLAPAPSGTPVGSLQGPFVYVGSSAGAAATVRVLDINLFARASVIKAPASVTDFGLSVTGAELGSGGRIDLAAGARGAVVLMRPLPSSWPLMQEDKPAILSSGPSWPTSGEFSSILAANLDGKGEDEIVAGAPSQNTVVVIWGTKACLDGAAATPPAPCESVLRIEPPAGARGFGTALLYAQNRLFVGAPEAGRVYLYKIDETHLQPGATAPAPEKIIEAPAGSSGFGMALAYGKFDGGASGDLLAVGAPNTTVGGAIDAGKVYLYDAGLTLKIADGVSLASPEGSGLLGRRLTGLPFRTPAVTADVLVAAGREALFLFFASLTPGHKDVRVR